MKISVHPRTEVTHKSLRAGKVKELDEAEVVSGHQVEAGEGNTSTVDVGLLCVTGPDPQDLVTEDAEKKQHRGQRGPQNSGAHSVQVEM